MAQIELILIKYLVSKYFQLFFEYSYHLSLLKVCYVTELNETFISNKTRIISLENLPSRYVFCVDKSSSREICLNFNESIQRYSFNIKKKNRKEKKKKKKEPPRSDTTFQSKNPSNERLVS